MQVFLLLSLTESTDGLSGTEKGRFVRFEGLALSAELQCWFYDQFLQVVHLCSQLIRSLVLIFLMIFFLGRERLQPLLQSCRQRSAVGSWSHSSSSLILDGVGPT